MNHNTPTAYLVPAETYEKLMELIYDVDLSDTVTTRLKNLEDAIEISEDEILKAYDKVSDNLLSIMEEAADNIRGFHEKQIEKSWFDISDEGTILGRKVIPLNTVGVYVPGGNNGNFSTATKRINKRSASV